jgi:hypothetical protein
MILLSSFQVSTGDGVVGFGVGGAWVVGGPTVVTTSIS